MQASDIEKTILEHIDRASVALIPEQNIKYYEKTIGFDIKKFCDTNGLDYIKDRNNIIKITRNANYCLYGNCN